MLFRSIRHQALSLPSSLSYYWYVLPPPRVLDDFCRAWPSSRAERSGATDPLPLLPSFSANETAMRWHVHSRLGRVLVPELVSFHFPPNQINSNTRAIRGLTSYPIRTWIMRRFTSWWINLLVFGTFFSHNVLTLNPYWMANALWSHG